MLRRTGPTPRPGYTMVELLVVILIIAILAALTTAAVVRAIGSGKRATTVSDLNNLNIALTSFNQKYGFYPPAYVVEPDSTGTQQVRRFRIPTDNRQPEFAVLRRMFPRWNPGIAADGVTLLTTGIDSQGRAAAPPTGFGTELDCNQVMVYFLGGPGTLAGPSSGLQTGWDVGGPFAPTGGTRKDPLLDFPVSRLTPEGGNFDGRYRDAWGTPIAYFSSNGVNYDPRVMFPWYSTTTATFSWGTAQVAPQFYTQTAPQTFPGVIAGSFQDSPGTFQVHPFRSLGRWVNPNGFQIVSAGPDQAFGAGSPLVGPAPGNVRDWTPGQAEYISAGGSAGATVGYDDLANFNSGAQLGETGK
jgi:prepilin-type N-terminal cleavage/methylation domain-containing protein